SISFLFFFNDTATTEIYTLSLHDALPIFDHAGVPVHGVLVAAAGRTFHRQDRKSTRLNSSHANISYAVFCLKKTYAQERREGRRNEGRLQARAWRRAREV